MLNRSYEPETSHSHCNAITMEGKVIATAKNDNVNCEGTNESRNTIYQTFPIVEVSVPKSSSNNWFTLFITKFRFPSWGQQNVLALIISILSWVAIYAVVGSDNLPGGIVFVLVFLEFGGRTTGYIVSLIGLPPMLGMLGLGILIRNVPYVDFGQHLPTTVASPIRQLSLAVILTRAGLGLDLNVLLRYKWLIARLAFLPTILEAVSVGVLVHFILYFPWLWSFLVGFVIAAVSPAVIVPRILALKEQGYGEEKGIPTIILAAASLDNIVAIALFGVMIGFTFSTESLAMTILQGPIEILVGCVSGFVWGLFSGILFNPSQGKVEKDETVFKMLVVLGGSVSFVLGFNRLAYYSAAVLSCLVSAFTTACIWRQRDAIKDFETIRWMFTFLWKFFEPLLFGVIGCQIVIKELDKRVVLLGIACLIFGAIIRFVTTFTVVSKAGLNVKEKFFFSISWVPKATVQAAIGPMALDLAQKARNKDDENLGLQVLTMAVLVILLTAPLGELGVMITGPRFLQKSAQGGNGRDETLHVETEEGSQSQTTP